MQVQIYPLVSDRTELQRFCDRWFNDIVPPQIAVFRPAFPMVFCVALRYRDMGSELAWQTGLMSQNELYFLVPLDRYRVESGRLQFVEHCVTTPYIFVDNPVSAIAGRERFGFPKLDCRFEGRGEDPLAFAGGALHHLSLSTWQPGTGGRKLAPLLHVMHEARAGFGAMDSDRELQLPPRGHLPGRTGILWMMRALAGELRARTSPGMPGELRGQLRELSDASRDGLCINVYNLRQFAHPLVNEAARYQDLVRMRMRLGDVQDVRLFAERFGLGEHFSVLLHRSAVLPIAQRLGLRVSSTQRVASMGDHSVDVLRARLPSYAQADVELLSSERLCWRVQQSGWLDDQDRQLTPHRTSWAPYNRTLGPSAASFLEPHPVEPVLDVKFLMLVARADAVHARIRAVLPTSANVDVTPLSVDGLTAVRIVVSRSRVRRASEREELVWLDGNYLSMSVPVVLRTGATSEVVHFLLQDFTDNGFLLQGNREVAATPTDFATFSAEPRDWLSASSTQTRLVSLETLVLDRTAAEARLLSSRVLDVFRIRPPTSPDTPRGAPARSRAPHDPSTKLRAELWPIIQSIRPVISVGSISSPSRPDVAVEQRLIRATFEETVVEPRAEGDRAYCVQFHHSETYPLVRDIGIQSMPVGSPTAALLREGLEGRIDSAHVVACAQAALQVRLTRMEVLWQRFGSVQSAT